MREHLREGSARQAIVVAGLLRRGFEVFSEEGNSSFDLVAYKYGELLRIEVKGITRTGGRFPKGPIAQRKSDCNVDRFDVLATVDGMEVQYNRSILHQMNLASMELAMDNEEYSIRTTNKNKQRAAMLAQEAQ